MTYNILIVDDQILFSEAVVEALHLDNRFRNIRTATNLKDAIFQIDQNKPNVILLDLNLGNQSGFNILSYIYHPDNSNLHDIKAIVLSVRRDRLAVHKAYKLNAKGYMDKTCHISELKDAIETVAHGGEFYASGIQNHIHESESMKNEFSAEMLSNREREVLGFLCESLTSKEIASQLNISFNTVNIYRKKLLSKFGVNNTSGLIKIAMQYGIVS